jgi:NAD(P)H-quinone oxidoreductase subunit 5
MGGGLASYLYLSPKVAKPLNIVAEPIRDFFAKDLYTAELYKNTVILGVAFIAKIIDWLDRYFVDGLINLLGLATLFSGQSLKYNNSGQSQYYAISIIAGILILVGLIVYPFISQLNF